MKTQHVAILLLAATACAEEAPPPAHPTAPPPPAPPALVAEDDLPPSLRLPAEPRPTSESILLKVDPKQEGFSGKVEIHLVATRPHSIVWLHAQDLTISGAQVVRDGKPAVPATWQPLGETGMGKLTFAETVAPGEVTLHIPFEGHFARGQHGIYRVREADTPYVFTQFESTSARYAFPCFDEPSFKIPFTTTLVIPKDLVGIANTHEASRQPEGNDVRVTFAPTPPLPSYLVAVAVGPFDVVAAPDVPAGAVRSHAVPLRAITPRGRGKDIAYALSHTGEILTTLEQYFGVEYPYDKLDILAVPGKGGAMENAGTVTFGEPLLLMDEATASVRQRKAYASVMAHELAHQWTGDLVTMAWWNDTWLNEAFATWMSAKAADTWDPKLHMDLSLLRGIQGAMNADALVNARAIRQPIETADDIENAFDTITYQKGAGVIGMFERWAGAEAWQKGVHDYLLAHRFGNATADDFLDAESAATGKDIKAAFHTFLDQPGVPLVTAAMTCATVRHEGTPSTARPPPPAAAWSNAMRAHQYSALALEQSRFLPLGSSGDAHETWQIPVCASTPDSGTCTLLRSAKGDLQVGAADSCPAWVMPNADAAGYYRFILDGTDLAKLRTAGLPKLSEREKVAYATSLRTAFARAATPTKDIFDALAPLARDPDPIVAEEPMAYVSQARDWLHGTPLQAKVEAYAGALYRPVFAKLGWESKDGTSAAGGVVKRDAESDETRALRGSVIGFLAMTARDKAVRAEAQKRGQAYLDALGKGAAPPVDQNVAGTLLSVVGEDAERGTWSAMEAAFSRSVDETVRAQLLTGMSLATDPTLARKALELALSPKLRDTEILTPIRMQLSRPETRERAWSWLKDNYDAVIARLPKHRGGIYLISSVGSFCDDTHADDAHAFFEPKLAAILGARRVLAGTVEDIKLCAARRQVHEPQERTMFGKR